MIDTTPQMIMLEAVRPRPQTIGRFKMVPRRVVWLTLTDCSAAAATRNGEDPSKLSQPYPDPMKKAIIDASSAIILYKTDLFDHLTRAYHLVMTRSVYHELIVCGYPGAEVFANNFRLGKFSITRPEAIAATVPPLDSAIPRMDRGERDTILAYASGAADFIIIDDGRAAGFCRKQTIPYINALLCPRVLFFAGRISETTCCAKTAGIINIGRYSAAVINHALASSGHDLNFFLP